MWWIAMWSLGMAPNAEPHSRAQALGLHVVVPSGCPDTAWLRQAVSRRVSTTVDFNADATLQIRVHVAEGDDAGATFVATIRAALGDGEPASSERSIHDTRCDRLMEATSVVIALLVDPEGAVVAPVTAEAGPNRGGAEPTDAPSEPESATTEDPRGVERTAVRPRDEPGTHKATARRARLEWRGYVGSGVGFGAMPGAWWIGETGTEVWWPRWGVRLGASYAGPASVGVGPGRARFHLLRLVASACGRRVARVESRLCLGVEGGTTLAGVRGLEDPQGSASPWLAVVPSAGLGVGLGRRFALGVDVRSPVPLHRPRYVVDGAGVVARAAPAGAEAALSFSFRR